MNYFQILDCNSNLGNCCSNKAIASLIVPISNIINLIQIVVPILLLIMISFNLTQLVINPDEKKLLKGIKNKALGAVIVFFVPVIVNVFINMVGDSSSGSLDVINCIKESGNVKLSSSVTYKDPNTGRKPGKLYTDRDSYEKGEKRKNTSSNYATPTGAISDACVLGDSNVKLVPNDTKQIDSVVTKVNGNEVAGYAKSWMNKGLTYVLGSSGELRPGGTCDCSHFVYKVLMHFNILKGGQIRSTVWGSCGVKGSVMYSSYDKLVPGDVVFMNVGPGLGHVEIYVGNGETVGCNSGRGITYGHNAKSYTSFIHLTAYD